jgi:hypothetical protein
VKRSLLAVFILSLALNAGVLGAAAYHVIAQRPFSPPPPTSGRLLGLPESPGDGHRLHERAAWSPRRVKRLERRVRLDGEQQAALRRSLEGLEREAAPVARRLHAERFRLATLLKSHPEPEEIRRHARLVSALQVRLDSLAAEGMIHEMAVLRPDQREEYIKAFRGERQNNRRRGF